MIATEFFAAGTEPDDTCHLHVGRSLLGRFAGWFSAPASQAQQGRGESAAAAEPAPSVAPVSPAQQAPTIAQPAEPEKKRGFWGRIFGRRDRNEPDKPDPKKTPPRPQ